MEGEGDGAGHAPPRRLRQLPSWLTASLAKTAHTLVTDALATAGLRKQHFAVLAALAEDGGLSQAALGRLLWIDPSDLHAILAELERDGLVARGRDQEDRRRNVVRLTRAGAAALARLDALVEAAQDDLLAPLSAPERDELRRLLVRLVEHHARARAAPAAE